MAETPVESIAPPGTGRRFLTCALKCVLSLWIVWHFAAVIVAPASIDPSSPLIRESWTWFRSYLQPMYLNHGYHYFAPQPAYNSTMLGWLLEMEDGSLHDGLMPRGHQHVQQTSFGTVDQHHDGPVAEEAPSPDGDVIRPRLLYHRHFMLTEYLAYPRPPDVEDHLRRSYARHLCRRHGAVRVNLSRILHYVPSMEAVLDGTSLVDPDSYVEEPLGTWQCDDL